MSAEVTEVELDFFECVVGVRGGRNYVYRPDQTYSVPIEEAQRLVDRNVAQPSGPEAEMALDAYRRKLAGADAVAMKAAARSTVLTATRKPAAETAARR